MKKESFEKPKSIEDPEQKIRNKLEDLFKKAMESKIHPEVRKKYPVISDLRDEKWWLREIAKDIIDYETKEGKSAKELWQAVGDKCVRGGWLPEAEAFYQQSGLEEKEASERVKEEEKKQKEKEGEE